MKLLPVVLAAFFIQSCYTVLYTADEYRVDNGAAPSAPPPEQVVIIEPPYRPCVPPPAPVVYVPTSAPGEQKPAAEPARLRDDLSAHPPAAVTPHNPEPARLRTNPTAQSAPARQSTVTNTPQTPQRDQNSARERVPAQQSQSETARPRTR